LKSEIIVFFRYFVNLLILNLNQYYELDKSSMDIYFFSRDRYACISIFNRGANIDEKIGSRIFDPFFTTKTIDDGTGLGLSTSYNLVKDHNGNLSYKNHTDGVE